METMGRILIRVDGKSRAVHLAGSNLLGRHWRCGIRVDDLRVPHYWVEIRWRHDHWGWRELSPVGLTSGSGASGRAGWRKLISQVGKNRRIRLGRTVQIELVDRSPPEILIEAVATGERIAGDDARKQLRGSTTLVPAATGPEAEAPRDGSLRRVEDRVFVVLNIPGLSETDAIPFDLTAPSIQLDLVPHRLEATFTLGLDSVAVRGECVRLLQVYAQARRDDGFDDGGWLTRTDAHAQWVALGGNPNSPPVRVGWDKGKIRSQLEAAGVVGVSALFDNRRKGGVTLSRIALDPSQLKELS